MVGGPQAPLEAPPPLEEPLTLNPALVVVSQLVNKDVCKQYEINDKLVVPQCEALRRMLAPPFWGVIVASSEPHVG